MLNCASASPAVDLHGICKHPMTSVYSESQAHLGAVCTLKKKFVTFLYSMCIDVKVSDPLELNFQTVVSCHVGAGN